MEGGQEGIMKEKDPESRGESLSWKEEGYFSDKDTLGGDRDILRKGEKVRTSLLNEVLDKL